MGANVSCSSVTVKVHRCGSKAGTCECEREKLSEEMTEKRICSVIKNLKRFLLSPWVLLNHETHFITMSNMLMLLFIHEACRNGMIF